MPSEAAMSDPIIGRRADLQALGRFVEALPDGGQALLIEGDAGIGKTALRSEALRAARERGFGVLFARSADAETRIAFATVGDLFTPVLQETLPSLVPVQRRTRNRTSAARARRVAARDARARARAGLCRTSARAGEAAAGCARRRAVDRFELRGNSQVRAPATADDQPVEATVRGRSRSRRRSSSTAPSRRSGGCRSSRSPSARSIGFCGADCR